jgi:ADP-ribose pyrophosphatase YjhB (NUDIX family)
MRYTVALIFSTDKTQIALIRKCKPIWQFDKLNGIGGKIEDDEHPDDAARRELLEESNLVSDDLRLFAIGRSVIVDNTYNTVVFFYTGTANLYDVHSNEKEPIEILSVYNALHYSKLIANLKWLIPLALDESTRITKFEISKLI